ncbi:MAG: hypothetical protein ACREUU_14435, partial [Gammaproteobacteria bacterium]
TLFNARLGWWLGNPANRDMSWRQGPQVALIPIVRELLGRTDEKGSWIYLSDGGHFDNLGLYEVVKRGCRYIVALDASADPDRRFDDLGNAIRKIRVDLGVGIELVEDWWIGAPDRGADGRYCALFSIDYKGMSVEGEGTLLYLKSAIYPHPKSRLPMDVLQYSRASGAFPHESTVDQFFTESQFESYRALGEHEMQAILNECKKRGDMYDLMLAARAHIQKGRPGT